MGKAKGGGGVLELHGHGGVVALCPWACTLLRGEVRQGRAWGSMAMVSWSVVWSMGHGGEGWQEGEVKRWWYGQVVDVRCYIASFGVLQYGQTFGVK